MEQSFDISPDELQIFIAEAEDHLQMLTDDLMQMERAEDNTEILQSAFRSAHTLKGMAGMIGHKRMVELTHGLEAAFDGLRKHTLSISTPLVDLGLDTVDRLHALCAEVAQGHPGDVQIEDLVEGLAAILKQVAPEPALAMAAVSPSSIPLPPAAITTPGSNGKKTTVKPEADLTAPEVPVIHIVVDISEKSIASAARAFQVLMALQDFGKILHMQPDQDTIEAAHPVRQFIADLSTSRSLAEIRKELCSISDLDRLVIQDEVIDLTQPAAPLKTIQPEKPAAVSPKPSAGSDNNPVIDKMMRISVDKLDGLMNLVGELITDRNRLYQLRNKISNEFRGNDQVNILAETVTHLGRITDQLQEEVMRVRMVPISSVFSKFPRLVRDLAKKTGKEIELVVHGEDTELDRSIIEDVNDPLIHLIRNSVDHGIERPDDRLAAGKRREGILTLSARHEQGHIIMTVQDDGKGIDINRLKASALEKGLMTEVELAALTDEKAIDLIFISGLSTAKSVTDVSGRGVGMDIVRNNIQRMNGSILVDSHLGEGTKFEIILPLTLAIVPTLLVKVENVTLAIPLVMVTETLRVAEEDIKTIQGQPVVRLREQVLPLLHLGEAFDFTHSAARQKFNYVVVARSNKLQVGLMVDTLIGEEEVVVKSLGSILGEIPGISSAAILGDGQVALIVDIPGLFKQYAMH